MESMAAQPNETLASRSNPATPRSSLGGGGGSGILRFVRNPKARSLANNGAVHRRVMQKQSGSPEEAASDFSRDKSRGAIQYSPEKYPKNCPKKCPEKPFNKYS